MLGLSFHSASRRQAGSFRGNAGKLHDLGPLRGFSGDEFGEVGGRSRQQHAAERDQARADLRIGKGALISVLSRSTISAGVLLGAPTPYHVLAS